jgi:hypothetical protein
MTSDPSSKLPSSAAKKLLKELPPAETMDELVSNLKQVGHRATFVLGAAYLDHALEVLLKAHFVPLGKREYNDFFNPSQNGFLSAFSPKIKVSIPRQSRGL